MPEATHLMVRNLARDPTGRSVRRSRAGNKTGFLMSDGTRIRRKNARPTAIPMAMAKMDAKHLTDGVRDCYIEVSVGGRKLGHEELGALLSGKAPAPKAAPKVEAAPEPVVEETKVTDLPPMPEPAPVSKKKTSRRKKES